MTDYAWVVQLGLIIIYGLCCLGSGYFLGRGRANRWWQDEMIRRRHAVYHWENGKWYWRENEPDTPRDPAATKVAIDKAMDFKLRHGGA